MSVTEHRPDESELLSSAESAGAGLEEETPLTEKRRKPKFGRRRHTEPLASEPDLPTMEDLQDVASMEIATVEAAELAEGGNMQEDAAEEQRPRKKKLSKKKKIKRILLILIPILLIAALIYFLKGRDKPEDESANVLTDMVTTGSITSVVEGNGVTKARKSAAIAVTSSGTVADVYVKEGDAVTAGTVLYQITSSATEDAVKNAQKEVDGLNKQLSKLYEAGKKLSVVTPNGGKLLEVATVKKGDSVTEGQVVAKLVDDSKMKLVQYYSYAYEKDIYLGQPATVSIPSLMQQVSGRVSEIKKVERISAEGTKLFCVILSVDNPGTLTAKVPASAWLSANGAQINPYELAELDYNSVTELRSKAAGEVEYTKLQDYMMVGAGETVLKVSATNNTDEVEQLQRSLATAQKTLADAQKVQAALRPVAPFDGKVVGLAIKAGDQVTAGTAAISIEDTSSILVEASIDERDINFVTPGTAVEIDQWGTLFSGAVESVSLSGKRENGMTLFPALIALDNAAGQMMTGSSVVYRISASQSENCLLVPLQAVKNISDPETGEMKTVVFVKSETPPENSIEMDGSAIGVPLTGFYAVPVTTGISDKYNVELKDGVGEGTEVFTQVMTQDSGMGGMM